MKRSLALLLAFVVLATVVAVLMPTDRRSVARRGAEEVAVRSESETAEPASMAQAGSVVTDREIAGSSQAQPTEGQTESTSSAPAEEGTGSLWIQVESRETGELLPGIRLRALVDPMEEGQAIVHASYSRGTQFESIVTDELGRAVYHLPTGRALRLEWWEDGFSSNVRFLEPEPLAPLEERDVVLRVSTEPDLVLVGRVVSSVDGAPLKRARVILRQQGRTLEVPRVREDGLFQLVTDSWRGTYLRVACAGYTPALVRVEAGHETAGTALEIALRPAAALRVFVHDANLLPLPEVQVVVRSRAAALVASEGLDVGESESFEWAAETDVGGRALLDDLPSLAALEVELFGRLFGSQREPERILLTPGETKDLVVQILPPGTLRGRLLDRDGEPVGGKEVWLRASDSPERYFECSDVDASVWAPTGGDGRFVFESVYAGAYLVGPCPACPPRRPSLHATANSHEVAPLAFPVEVGSGEEQQVELVVDRELYVSVTVVDEEGRPPAGSRLEATSVDPQGPVGVVPSVSPNVFELGPLQQGTLELFAAANNRSARVRVHSERGAVELVVRPTRESRSEQRGRISGRVVSPREGQLFVFVQAARISKNGERSVADGTRVNRVTGEFAIDDLLLGTYQLSATEGDLFATQRVTLDSRAGEVRGVLLRLDDGGMIALDTGLIFADEDEPRTSGYWEFQVEFAGERVRVDREFFSGPRSGELQVPAGELTVRLWRYGTEERQTRVIQLRPRQRKVVTFAFD